MESGKPAPGGAPAEPTAVGAPAQAAAQPAAQPTAPPVMPPKIDSAAFARRRGALQGQVEIASLPRLVSAGVEGRGVLAWQIEGYVGRDHLQRQREFLRVRTTYSPWMTCAKCLEPVEVTGLRTDTRFRFAASEQQAAVEDRESEEEEVIAASPNLDLAALVEDEAILALPMAPAHVSCEWVAQAGSEPGGDV